MKLTNSEVIRNGERDLIDAISGELDWHSLEEVFRKEHNLTIDEDVEYRRGDIVVHDHQVAYKLEFQVKVTLSVLVDREGNCLSVESNDTRDDRNENDERRSVLGKQKTISPDVPEGQGRYEDLLLELTREDHTEDKEASSEPSSEIPEPMVARAESQTADPVVATSDTRE